MQNRIIGRHLVHQSKNTVQQFRQRVIGISCIRGTSCALGEACRALERHRVLQFQCISCIWRNISCVGHHSYPLPPPISMLPVLGRVVLTPRCSLKTGWPPATLNLGGGRGGRVGAAPRTGLCVSGSMEQTSMPSGCV